MATVNTTDLWIETMHDRMEEMYCDTLEDFSNWKQYFHKKETDDRQMSFGEFRRPDKVVETPEGQPYVALETVFIRETGCVQVKYTGTITYTEEMKKFKKYDEMEEKTWGLAEAVARKPYEDAVNFLMDGIRGSRLSSDGEELFSITHPLDNSSSYDINYLTTEFSAQAIQDAMIMFGRMKDENGNPMPFNVNDELQVIVPLEHWNLAQQLAQRGEYLPNSANFNENMFRIKPILEPMLQLASEDWGVTQYYIRLPKRARNMYVESQAPTFRMFTDDHTQNTTVSVSTMYVFHAAGHRGIIGSKGTGS